MPRASLDRLRLVDTGPVPPQPEARAPGSPLACIARIIGVDKALLQLELQDGSRVLARTAVRLRNLQDEVLVLGLHGGQHVVVGQLLSEVAVDTGPADELLLKAERVHIEAGAELVLVAGGCRLHLDARGKVLTTAEQIVSRARGANKVQGGTVQLN